MTKHKTLADIKWIGEEADRRKQEIIKVDIAEALALAEAAQAMLAALKDVREALSYEGRDDAELYDVVDNAIAQAETAGITTGEDE